jgi:hypothetical protein
LDGIEYRGTAFLQCFTTCQPEHGVADDMALTQAQRVRDSRGAPEFIFNPRLGETYQEALDLKGNPSLEKDWYETKFKATNEPYRYTVAHWCATEARFRNHLKKIKTEDAAKLIPLENMLVRVTQQDVVYRRYLISDHRSYIADFGVYIKVQGPKGEVEYRSLSRQLVLFCVERRKAWRMLQSKAGIENKEYKAQRAILADVDASKISREDFFSRAEELLKARLEIAVEAAPRPAVHPVPAVAAKPPANVAVPVSKSQEIAAPAPAAPTPVVSATVTAIVSETVKKSQGSQTSEVVIAMAAQIARVEESENESEADWNQGTQIRLMELDVDPGHDAERGPEKAPGI